MPPSLYGVMAKRDRANDHLERIERHIQTFFDSNPYPFATERHPEHGLYQARLIHPKDFPATELSLMIGDCVHNMRSALDYIAWELAGGNINDMQTMFPIFDTKAGFDRRGRKRIEAITNEDVRTKIERFQPYNSPGPFPTIAAIQKVDAADKHKLLTVTVALLQESGIDGRIPPQAKATTYKGHFVNVPGIRLVHDAIIATYSIAPPCPEMQVDFVLTPQVEFGDNLGLPARAYVVHNLKLMLGEVDFFIQEFTLFFETSGVST